MNWTQRMNQLPTEQDDDIYGDNAPEQYPAEAVQAWEQRIQEQQQPVRELLQEILDHAQDVQPAPTPAPEEEYLRGEIAKAQHQLDHADELEVPQVGRDAYRDVIRWTKRAITVATLAIALLSTQPASAAPLTPPVGCTVVGVTGEGFPLAHCSTNAYMYADMDGTTNRALGTWVDAPYYSYEAQ